MRIEVVGEALGGLSDRVDVHPVGARPEDPAQARGPKGELAVEGVLERFRRLLELVELSPHRIVDIAVPFLELCVYLAHDCSLVCANR